MYWEDALHEIPAKSYRLTRNGKYEAFCSDHSHSIFLGTYDTPEKAEEASYNYRANRLVSRVEEYGLNIDDGVVFMDNYIAFSNGVIFNLHGERIRGGINRDGYHQVVINGRTTQTHRIIASIFCERESGEDFVNHIDGNKQNNDASNLEWCTRSENALHAFSNGLQTNVAGIPIYTDDEKRYMIEHRHEHFRDVAAYLGRNPETVRKYMSRFRKEYDDD